MPHPCRADRLIRPRLSLPMRPAGLRLRTAARLIRRYGLAPWLRSPVAAVGLACLPPLRPRAPASPCCCRCWGLPAFAVTAPRPGFALLLPLLGLPGVFTALRHGLAPVVRAVSLLATGPSGLAPVARPSALTSSRARRFFAALTPWTRTALTGSRARRFRPDAPDP